MRDISRVFELWGECLDRSGGPFLFGEFSIADAMYFPVLTRFHTYGIALAGTVAEYARSLDAFSSVSPARPEPAGTVRLKYVTSVAWSNDPSEHVSYSFTACSGHS